MIQFTIYLQNLNMSQELFIILIIANTPISYYKRFISDHIICFQNNS